MSKPKISDELFERYIINEALLGLDESDLVDIDQKNPLITRTRYNLDNPATFTLYLLKQPEYVAAACKYLLNLEITPQQGAVLYNMMTHSFPFLIGSRGFSKTFLLAVYCVLMGTLNQGIKIVVVGAGLRQSRHVYEYACKLWDQSPVLRSLFNATGNKDQGPKFQQDRFLITLGESKLSFLPIGDGEKIRGERAGIIIIDELQSQNPEILERVVSGFALVNQSPLEAAKSMATFRRQQEYGIKTKEPELKANQIIYAGTAYYQFNHMYEYFKKYRDKIQQKIGNDYHQHVLMRIPYELIPEGFMDAGIAAKMREGGITGVAEMELGAVFSKDSNGFFKASIINNAVAKAQNNIFAPRTGGPIEFYATMRGQPTNDLQYVIACDPASEHDNLSIIIIEVWQDHRRIVYGWSTNKKEHREKLTANITTVDGYYSYCAQKIRELGKLFNTTQLVIDSQGGGYAVMEALNEEKNMSPGDMKWWPVIDEEKEQPTDNYSGLHNIHVIQMANADWVYNANHDLKKDIEGRVLLFPYSNPIDYAIDDIERVMTQRVETVEDVVYELEELKNELVIIEHTKTPNGRDKWDIPKLKITGQVKPHNQLKKDRYSALLMCNAVARTIHAVQHENSLDAYRGIGVGINDEIKPQESQRNYVGADWYAKAMDAFLTGYNQ